MKNYFFKILFTLSVVIFSEMAYGQSQPEMADALRASGKIYVVVAVLSIVLAGIFIYLFALDRKLSALEKKTNFNNT